MNKFKKMMSVTLASCMAASALMMSAGAANTPVDTGTATLAPNVISRFCRFVVAHRNHLCDW